MRNALTRVTGLAIAGMLCACSGGQGPVPQVPRASKTGTAPATLVIRIPQATTAGTAIRKPQYVSVGTKSIAINSWNFNTSPGSPNCATVAGSLQCTETIDAPIGNSSLMVTAYDKPLTATGATQGNQLSTATVGATVIAGIANTIKLTLLGVPAKATLTLGNASPPQGQTSTTTLTLDVRDADNFVIVGNYSSAISLGVTNGNNITFTVNGTSTYNANLQSPSDTVTMTYTGSGTRKGTITAALCCSFALLGSVPFTPVPAFGPAIPVLTSLVNASAQRQLGGPNQPLLFTEPAKNSFASMANDGTITQIPVPSGATPFRMATVGIGPVDFTESTNSIGALSMMGFTVFIETPVPTANAGVYEITGYDSTYGRYFSEKNTGKIGYVGSPIKEFPTGLAHSAPAGIVAASNGAWFADPGANAIAFMTFAGGVTAYPVPTAGAQPTEITDSQIAGHYWFTEPGASKIGSFDPAGNIVEYPIGAVPTAIAGAYGTDVFVLTAAHTILDVDPTSGTFTTLTPPVSAYGPPVGIAIDGIGLLLLRSDGVTGAFQELNYD